MGYFKVFEKYSYALEKKLLEEGIGGEVIDDIINSGYYLFNDYIFDSLYGNTNPLTINQIKGNIDLKLGTRKNIVTVNSIEEAIYIIVNEYQSSHFYKEGMMSFRGQVKEFFIERPYPNPWFSSDGKERLIIPSAWREYVKDINKLNERPETPVYPVLGTIFSDEILYDGLDIDEIVRYNNEKYGIHTMGDLGDFPEDFNKEIYRRYSSKIYFCDHASILEQHYGFQTCGLDITYNIAVAFFFATHQFVEEHGKATFKRLNNFDESVVYSFVFRNPPVKKSEFYIKKIEIFEHLTPIRPLRQECALPFFHVHEFNGAATALHLMFKIGDNFDFSAIPTAKHLFPDSNADPFYKKLLELKYKNPEVFGCVPDYKF